MGRLKLAHHTIPQQTRRLRLFSEARRFDFAFIPALFSSAAGDQGSLLDQTESVWMQNADGKLRVDGIDAPSEEPQAVSKTRFAACTSACHDPLRL